MQLFHSLAAQVAVFGPHFDVALNWIGDIIKAIITGVSSVGIGILLFSLILKVIVLPVDVMQRITMRKQNIKMKENQDRMEKLQKQYANNKDLYNQKVMEMYKENGMGACSSCLPMIISMVIFIVAINAFNAFSQYANIENYNTMLDAYNQKIESYCPDLSVDTIQEQDGHYVVSDGESLIYYTVPKSETALTGEELVAYIQSVPNYSSEGASKAYYVNTDAAMNVTEIADYVAAKEGVDVEVALREYFEEQGALAAKQAYETQVYQKTSFLWIKNVWVTDASYKHPILDYSSFQTEISREEFEINGEEYALGTIKPYTNAYEQIAYETVTSQMGEHKSEANGYFILIALSIGTILLQQVISNRAQKEQQKYSTVDGQGAMQQKTMMVMMTAMFAIFSFMYSAAFSIYLITSNVFSILSTFVINKIVDHADKKKKAVDVTVSSRYAKTVKNSKNNKDK